MQDQGWLQVTGAGALGRIRDFPCKIDSNRQREPDPREGIRTAGTPEGPPQGPRVGEMEEEKGGGQQGLERGERG